MKNTNRNTADLFLIVALLFIVSMAALFFAGIVRVHAAPIGDTVHAVLVVHGDCTADNSNGDMYTGVTDGEMDTLNTPRVICYVPPADGIANEVHKDARKNATDAVVVANTPVVVVTVEPVAPVVEYGNDTPDAPVVNDAPETPEDDKPHCDNGAGNGDDCTPGHSSGSNQGKGGPDGDRTNQGENGNKGGQN